MIFRESVPAGELDDISKLSPEQVRIEAMNADLNDIYLASGRVVDILAASIKRGPLGGEKVELSPDEVRRMIEIINAAKQ